MAESETPDALASRLIDAWCADKGKQIPWAKAIQIGAIVTKLSDEERDRLLHLGDDDGSCEMCGRNAIAAEARAESLQSQLAATQEMLKVATCPNRNCSDGAIISTGPDPEYEQCQWCYERAMLIDATQGENNG